MKKEHLHGLDLMRYLLGVYIVLYHTFHYSSLPDIVNKFTGVGFISTSTFFILSGFILSYVYYHYNEGENNYYLKEKRRSFLLKRLANLYPIHLFSLLLTLIVVTVLGSLEITPEDKLASLRYVMYDSNNYTPIEKLHHWMSDKELIAAFFMNIFLVHSWNPFYLSFNAPSWSISTLFFMYLIFPFIAPKILKNKHPGKSLILINLVYIAIPCVFILMKWFDMPFTGIINRNPLVRMFEFIAGIMLCNFYLTHKDYIRSKSKVLFLTGIPFILVSCYLAGILLTNPDVIMKGGNGSYYLLHTGLMLLPECLIVILFCNVKIEKPKIVSLVKRLGGASLPMFALHIPLYLMLSRAEIYFFEEKHLWVYPFYLLVITYVCVVFQEKLVVPVRKIILKVANVTKKEV